jgi:hypothetical protein
MKLVFVAITLFAVLTSETIKIDFGTNKSNTWSAVSTDEKKVSSATVSYSHETVRLTGYKESNDKIAPSLIGPIHYIYLEDYTNVKVRYRSKGTPISMVMKIDLKVSEKDFIYPVENTSGEWKIIEIPLNDFIDRSSENLELITKKELKNINRYGFITTNDFVGPYAIEVDYIEFI